MRKCSKCLGEFPLGNFNKTKRSKDGLMHRCKSCFKIEMKKHRSKYKEYDKEYAVKYREKNKESIRKRDSAYSKLYKREKRKDPEFRLKEALRSYFYKQIKLNNSKKNGSVLKYIGCTVEELRNYLSSQFLPEMNWDNYGSYWEIDHKVPVSSFGVDEESLKQCWNYSNLQPLTINENRKKKNKIL